MRIPALGVLDINLQNRCSLMVYFKTFTNNTTREQGIGSLH